MDLSLQEELEQIHFSQQIPQLNLLKIVSQDFVLIAPEFQFRTILPTSQIPSSSTYNKKFFRNKYKMILVLLIHLKVIFLAGIGRMTISQM